MAKIFKEKNFIVYEKEDGKYYKLNIDNGELLSLKGVPMQTTPAGMIDAFRSARGDSLLLAYVYGEHDYGRKYTHLQQITTYMQMCDKLDSLGVKYGRLANGGYINPRTIKRLIDYVSKDFNTFVKVFNANKETFLEDLVEIMQEEKFVRDMQIDTDHINAEELEALKYLYECGGFDLTELKYANYFVARGLYYFFDKNQYSLRDSLRTFFYMCKMLNLKPEKSDYYKQYIMVKRNYEMNKKEIDNNRIVYQLGKHSKAWEFENDEFCIVVPKCVEDFKHEAEFQSNCVYTHYLSRVQDERTNVVFIRKKSNPDMPYITCEVSNEGYIRQYLLKHNCSVNHYSPESEFEIAFQNHLSAVWEN